ncbi:MAG: phosphotransferase family protein [Gammaproteobacteria bacterium]|nr:phosphotransferase family protein [Gammaproteobacteria bacterium]
MAQASAVLNRWRELRLPFESAPRLVRPLPGGLTNATFLIEADGCPLVLRLSHPQPGRLGIDRQRELRLLSKGAAAGIAPSIIHAAPDDGILVTEYLDMPAAPLPRTDAQAASLLDSLTAIHALDPGAEPVFDYVGHLDRYWQALQEATAPSAALTRRHARVRDDALAFQQGIGDGVICHHDPVPANALADGGQWRWIDWEYGARGDRLFDYAVVHSQWGLPESAFTDSDAPRFALALNLYQHLCELWAELR